MSKSQYVIPSFRVGPQVVELESADDQHPVFDKTKILSLAGDDVGKLIELVRDYEKCRLAATIQKRLMQVEDDIKKTAKSRAKDKPIHSAFQFGERNGLLAMLQELLSK